MPLLGNHTLSHGVLSNEIVLAQEDEDGDCLKKTAFSSVFPLVGPLHTIFCRFWFVAKAEERTGSRCRSPSLALFPELLSLPSSVWSHLDGWPSFLSRGNSTHTAASSCVSSSVLTEELDSRAWNRARKISWPSLPPSLGGCLNHSKGERCLFSSPKPPSFFFSFPLLSRSYFQTLVWAFVQLETRSSRPHLD